jgi:hypothetical protein
LLKLWKNVIAPIVVVLLVFVSLQVVSARKSMAAKNAIFKACIDQGMDVTWTSETHGFTTDTKVECVRP